MVVVIFHDHGSRYLAKMFNDDWMRERGFLEPTGLTARDLVSTKRQAPLVTVDRRETVARTAHVMTEHGFSQIPICADGRIIGAISEARLYSEIVKNPEIKRGPVESIMQPAFPFVDVSTSVESLAAMLTPENPAVLVRDFKSDETYIITRSDVIQALS
jgi:cystathionine beta-synthase